VTDAPAIVHSRKSAEPRTGFEKAYAEANEAEEKLRASGYRAIDVPEAKKRGTHQVHRGDRKALNREIYYGYYDPDCLRSADIAPPQVQAAFEDMVGTEPEFKIRRHPLLPDYWAAFQRAWHPDAGRSYQCFSIFMEPPVEEELPSNLKGTVAHAHLRGLIGEPRLPDRRDFEVFVRDADLKRLGPDGVEKQLCKPQDEELREAERVTVDQEHDIIDYNYLRINAAANGGKLQMIAPNRDDPDERKRLRGDKVMFRTASGLGITAVRGSRHHVELLRERDPAAAVLLEKEIAGQKAAEQMMYPGVDATLLGAGWRKA